MKTKNPAASAQALIRQEIERGGPLRFERFVEIALYHPAYGYYSRSTSPRGRAGDYFTSVQASGLFPQIFTDALRVMRHTLGTEQFSLIEVGSGDGEFLEGVLKTLEAAGELKGLRVWAVERSRSARDRMWRRLSRFPRCEIVPSLEEIEWTGGLEGCIVSNEFFDALPFHRLRRSSEGWKEVYVDIHEDALREKEGPVSDAALVDRLGSPLEFEEGQEIEVRPAARSAMEEWGAFLSRGYVVTFDYGYPRAQLYDPARRSGTWQCFHKHSANTRPLEDIGGQDITAHVDFTALAEAGSASGLDPALFCSQGIFLTHLGKDRIETFLKGNETASRKGQVMQLLHPQAMGQAFWVLVQTKGIGLPSEMQTIPNRLRRLS